MSPFEFEQMDGLPDHAFIRVDGKYTVVVICTPEGIIIDVYPTGWDSPIDSMGVHDHDVVGAHEDG
jgi:hypothetical protein